MTKMCNTVYCGFNKYYYKPGMCKRNVQTGCTGYVHIAAMRKMENDGCYS